VAKPTQSQAFNAGLRKAGIAKHASVRSLQLYIENLVQKAMALLNNWPDNGARRRPFVRAMVIHQSWPNTTMRIIFRLRTIKRQGCQSKLRRQNNVIRVGKGG
jgi:hypothetical protein